MDINAEKVISILNTAFGFEKVSTPIGYGVRVTSREGFIFSSVTGAGYLDNIFYPFSPKGLLKIFNSCLDFKFVTGIFDNSSLRHTPFVMNQIRNYLFSGDKIIVPFEFEKESNLQDKLRREFNNKGIDSNIILLRLETNKKGFGLEPFFEYLACKYFNSKGYITETQIPLSYNWGSPDFGCFWLKEIINEISSFGILPLGFNVVELSLIRLYRQKYLVEKFDNSDIIVGEAKTSTTQMQSQIEKYLSSEFFDYAIEIHPFKKSASNNLNGLFTIENNNLVFILPKKLKLFSNKYSQEKYIKWLSIYFRIYILANYTNDELNKLFKITFNENLSNQSDIIKLVNNYSISDHFNLLLNYIENGDF